MTEPDSRCPTCGAPIGKLQHEPTETPAVHNKEQDRETDHRGVVMPRRTRIGGIIVPQ